MSLSHFASAVASLRAPCLAASSTASVNFDSMYPLQMKDDTLQTISSTTCNNATHDAYGVAVGLIAVMCYTWCHWYGGGLNTRAQATI